MTVYRIQKSKYGKDISGSGSTLVDGRWHRAGGLPMLYTTSNSSLSILEVLVHIPQNIKPPAVVLLEIDIPTDKIVSVSARELPAQWKSADYVKEVQDWGMIWLESKRSLAISVPSAISFDHNILINPNHPDFRLVRVTKRINDFKIDHRLL